MADAIRCGGGLNLYGYSNNQNPASLKRKMEDINNYYQNNINQNLEKIKDGDKFKSNRYKKTGISPNKIFYNNKEIQKKEIKNSLENIRKYLDESKQKKFAHYHINSFNIITQCYLNGFLKDKNEENIKNSLNKMTGDFNNKIASYFNLLPQKITERFPKFIDNNKPYTYQSIEEEIAGVTMCFDMMIHLMDAKSHRSYEIYVINGERRKTVKKILSAIKEHIINWDVNKLIEIIQRYFKALEDKHRHPYSFEIIVFHYLNELKKEDLRQSFSNIDFILNTMKGAVDKKNRQEEFLSEKELLLSIEKSDDINLEDEQTLNKDDEELEKNSFNCLEKADSSPKSAIEAIEKILYLANEYSWYLGALKEKEDKFNLLTEYLNFQTTMFTGNGENLFNLLTENNSTQPGEIPWHLSSYKVLEKKHQIEIMWGKVVNAYELEIIPGLKEHENSRLLMSQRA